MSAVQSSTPPRDGRPLTKTAGRLAVVTAVATWVLLMVGCLVHGTGSSLACPDWPLCFGTAFPKMENGVQFEHTHRLVATAVGILTISLAVVLHRQRAFDRAASKMGYLAAFLVCVQGTLGGVTVLMKLPIAVTLAHLATSMAFFCLTVIIALRTATSTSTSTSTTTTTTTTTTTPTDLEVFRPWVGGAVLATLAQIVLGGLVRHTSSGLACFGIPLCNGEAWPSHYGAHLHMSHRFFAVALGVFVIGLATKIARRAPGTRYARLATLAIVLVLVQVGLGVVSVLSMLALAPVTLHLGVAALLLVCNVALFYYLPARARSLSGAGASLGSPQPDQHGDEAARAW